MNWAERWKDYREFQTQLWRERETKMDEILKRNAFQFEHVFDVPLAKYWDSDLGGLQIAPFMTEVLEYKGPHVYNATAKKFGVSGLRIVGRILSDIMEYWTVPF